MKSILVLGLWLTTATATAHPTSFKDAFGVMSYNTAESNELLLTYSLTHKFAVSAIYIRDSKSDFYVPRLNFLVHRWNNDNSQANLYLSGGLGYEKFADEKYGVRFAEFVADWESREKYIYLDHIYMNRDNKSNPDIVGDYNHTKFRLGVAPFLADYSDLNVWLIVQAEKHLRDPQIELTQFARFYVKNILWEIGARFDGGWAFNYMVHF